MPSFSLKQFLILIFITGIPILLSVGTAKAATSTLSLPVTVDLKELETLIQSKLPDPLVSIREPRQVCVKAKWGKTKIGPDLSKCSVKGIKVHCPSKWVETKISPELKCDPQGWVKKAGPLKLWGENDKIKVSIPIKARVSAKNIGGIIKSESADAAATITASIGLGLSSDWTPVVSVDPDFTWNQRPTIKLLDFIKITVGSKVEPELRRYMNEFKNDIPQHLAKLEIKSKIEEAWNTFQTPMVLSEAPPVYLKVNPQSVGFSEFSIRTNRARAVVSIKASPEIVTTEPSSGTIRSLPPLQSISGNSTGFTIQLPVRVSFDTINAEIQRRFPKGMRFDVGELGLPGDVEIDNIEVLNSSGLISISSKIKYDERSPWLKKLDVFDWFSIEGTVGYEVLPKIDSDRTEIFVTDIDFNSDTNNELVDALVKVARLPVIMRKIEQVIRYDFGDKVDATLQDANKALNRKIGDKVSLTGSISTASLNDMSIEEDGIRIDSVLDGAVEVDVGF